MLKENKREEGTLLRKTSLAYTLKKMELSEETCSVETIVINDISKVCRTCLKQEEPASLIPIKDTYLETVLVSELLKRCIHLKLEENDLYPQQICTRCIEILGQINDFKTQSLDNEKLLPLLIGSENQLGVWEMDLITDCNKGNYIDDSLSSQDSDSDPNDNEIEDALKKEAVTKSFSIEKLHKCSKCPQKFKDKPSLETHSLTHPTKFNFQCCTCGNGFMKLKTLKKHQQTCLVDGIRKRIKQQLKCKQCDRVFSRANDYKYHIKTHEPNFKSTFKKPDIPNHAKHLCSFCGKYYGTPYSLLVHVRIHTGEKPYRCDICDKVFRLKSSQIAHKRIHLGIKPYKCLTCGKAYTQQGQLQVHTATHTGERPYKCPYCEKAFAIRGNLTAHVKMHSGGATHVCDFCGCRFKNAGPLNKHKIHCCKATEC